MNADSYRQAAHRLFRLEDEDDYEALEEVLATNQHEIWSHWMKYLFSCCEKDIDGNMTIPVEKVKRWRLQMTTEFANLTEEEKQSDRDIVRRFIFGRQT